jgi:phosphoribosylformylglycinamidine synthase
MERDVRLVIIMVNTIVLRVDGTNCDEETCIAFELAGSKVDLVHVNELKRGIFSLEDYEILAIPGGFAYGDDIAAGKILANLLKYELRKPIKKFIEEGKLVIGICNGFQAIVKAGLLPAFGGLMETQEATLAMNDSGYFIDKWVLLKHVNKGKCVFTRGISNEIFIPINHAEGKFVATPEILKKLEDNDQVVFKYVDNPNGSLNDIAGICNTEGNVFGLMPHPEKYVHPYTHPYWTRLKDLPKEGDGLVIFRNAVEYARKRF